MVDGISSFHWQRYAISNIFLESGTQELRIAQRITSTPVTMYHCFRKIAPEAWGNVLGVSAMWFERAVTKSNIEVVGEASGD